MENKTMIHQEEYNVAGYTLNKQEFEKFNLWIAENIGSLWDYNLNEQERLLKTWADKMGVRLE